MQNHMHNLCIEHMHQLVARVLLVKAERDMEQQTTAYLSTKLYMI